MICPLIDDIYGGFLSHGSTPSSHPFFPWLFRYKPSSYCDFGGSPMTMDTPTSWFISGLRRWAFPRHWNQSLGVHFHAQLRARLLGVGRGPTSRGCSKGCGCRWKTRPDLPAENRRMLSMLVTIFDSHILRFSAGRSHLVFCGFDQHHYLDDEPPSSTIINVVFFVMVLLGSSSHLSLDSPWLTWPRGRGFNPMEAQKSV